MSASVARPAPTRSTGTLCLAGAIHGLQHAKSPDGLDGLDGLSTWQSGLSSWPTRTSASNSSNAALVARATPLDGAMPGETVRPRGALLSSRRTDFPEMTET
eukprot:1727673-Prymnesium_polylepis.1